MIAKFNLYILLAFSLVETTLFCQTPATITKSSPESGWIVNKATTLITLNPGYAYTASSEYMEAAIEQLTPYGPLYTPTTFNASTINTSLLVGAVGGGADVSGTGAGSYSIPIQIPSGTNNVVPSVSVSYSSQAGDGIMGIGWNITGLSAISLVGTSRYYDNKVDEVQLDGKDKFALDGGRLFATTGTYGANNTVYSTEVESYSKITSFGTGLTPDWFQVQTKDGMTMEYGKNSDSRVVNRNGNAISWLLNKVYDANGNYMIYEYRNENFDTRIDKISYTGNTTKGVVPYNYIKFNYKERNDKNVRYEAGSIYNLTNLLNSIDIFAENEHFKSYQFSYGENAGSFLTSVTELGANNETLNPTIFKYGDAGLSFETLTCSNFNGLTADFQTARDYNGDGKTDLLAQHYSYDSQGNKYYTKWEVFTSTSDNGFTHYASGDIPVGFAIYNKKEGTFDDNTIGQSTSLDIYGDGKSDLLLWNYSKIVGGGLLTDVILINIIGADYFTSENLSYPFFDGNGYYFNPSKGLQIGDFNGDGRDEVLFLKYNSQTDHTYSGMLYFGLNLTVLLSSSNLAGMQYMDGASDVYASDFDGDGKQEVMVLFDNTAEMFEYQSTSSFQRIYITTRENYVYPGDFNGDGKTDVLMKGPTTSWKVYFSDGDNLIKQPFSPSTYYDPNGTLRIADINGDGKSDIISAYSIWNGGSSSSSKIEVSYSTGLAFNKTSNTVGVILTFDDFAIGDFNGDGKSEIFNRELYTSPASLYYFNRNGQDRLLTGIKDGFNRTTTLTYNWLSQSSNYTSGTLATVFPVYEGAKPLPIVTRLVKPDGNGGNSATYFNYQGAKWHIQGKGFLGFSKLITNNSISGVTNSKTSELKSVNIPGDLGIRQMLLKNEENSYTSSGQLISKTTYTNTLTSLGNLRYKVQVDKIVSEDFVNTTSTTATMVIDGNGNTTSVTTSNGVETSTVTNTYTTFGSWWIPSRVSSSTSTNTRTGQTAYSRTKSFTYDTKGNLKQQISDPSTPKSVTTDYTYDACGLPTQTIVSSAGLPSITSKVTYDANDRIALSTINTLNQTTMTVNSYDKKWGKPTSVTDVSGLTSTFTYNGFGEVTSTKDPLGNVSTVSRVWDITSGGTTTTVPQNTLFYSLAQAPNTPYSKVWYDVLGREVKTETQTRNGASFSVVKFDVKGNVSTSTSPFLVGGTAPIITTSTYDFFNRPKSVTDGTTTTTFTYSATAGKITSSVTSAGKTKTQIADASGKVTSSTDNGGTVNFTYFSSGAQKNNALGTTIMTEMEYDIYGRQTKLSDKNAGITLYEYNAYGQLISQTDPNNVIQTIQYDALGRETANIGPDGTTTTTYVASGNGINQPLRETSFNGSYFEYQYDAYDRVKSETKFVDGQSFTNTYDYNTDGSMSALTYPSGFKVKLNYSTIGDLSTITNETGSTTLFSLPTTNQNGQYTSYKLGNNKTTTLTYNNLGILTNIVAPGVQNYEVSFNASTGNLTYRKDYIKDKIETFGYDNLDRFSTYQVNSILNPVQSPVNTVVTYSNNGNILNKAGVGDYVYDASKINAVTEVQNSNVIIPSLQETITYTKYDRTETIAEGDMLLTLKYGPDLNRIKSVLTNAGTTVKTKYFIGNYEKEVTPTGTKEIHYIPTAGGASIVYLIENGVGSYYYLYKDHLGSIVSVTNNTGAVVYEQSFDAWGKRRNPTNWADASYTPSSSFSWVRGFTGHEHLDEFGLINMNNRMYDPVLGRMLAVDNFVQNPFFTQSYNRYSYCFNNPLKYTDPNGEFPVIAVIVGAAIGAYIGGSSANGWELNPGKWENSATTRSGILIGAVLGGFGGWGFGVGAPALAGTSFFYNFGLSGTVAAYTLVGGASGAAIGYTSGYTGGLLYSHGNQNYALKSGMHGALLGFGAGTALGAAAGGYKSYTPQKVKLQYLIDQNKEELISDFGEETFYSTKPVSGYTPGNHAGTDPDNEIIDGGFSKSSSQTITISRTDLNRYYRGEDMKNIRAALFHEYFHANEYHWGIPTYEFNYSSDKYGNSYDYFKDPKEFRAYEYEHYFFNTVSPKVLNRFNILP